MTELTDEELITRIIAGDREAFYEMRRRYNSFVVNFARSITRNKEDAEDVAQNTWMQVLKKANQWRGEGKFTSWLGTITLNECRMLFRSREDNTVSLDQLRDAIPSEIDAQFAAVDSGVEFLPERLAMERALDLLAKHNPRLGNIFHLVLAGFSGKEIAEATNLSLASVKNDIHRARVFLKKTYKGSDL